MKRIGVAVYTKISGEVKKTVEAAFYKAVMLRLSSYIDGALYGVAIDLPDSLCYRSHGDAETVRYVEECFLSLPKRYRDVFFAVVRARRYNVKNKGANAFVCENGMRGARSSLLYGKEEYVFSIGRGTKGFEVMYFSASDGLIESGGIKRLIKIALEYGKNVLPSIKADTDVLSLVTDGTYGCKRSAVRGKGRFFEGEGLFIRSANGRSGDIGGGKGRDIMQKDVLVFKYPHPFIGNDGVVFIKKESFPRFSYRAAVAAGRVFRSVIENGCDSIGSGVEAAEVLTALPLMHVFGFLGEEELNYNSEQLLCSLQELVRKGIGDGDKGKLLFLLTVTAEIYKRLSLKNSYLLPIGVCVKNLSESIGKDIMTKDALYRDVYLIMCYKNLDVSTCGAIGSQEQVSAVFSESEDALVKSIGSGVWDIEGALAVLIRAANLCFKENVKSIAVNIPIVAARLSFLMRTTQSDVRKRGGELAKSRIFKPAKRWRKIKEV